MYLIGDIAYYLGDSWAVMLVFIRSIIPTFLIVALYIEYSVVVTYPLVHMVNTYLYIDNCLPSIQG